MMMSKRERLASAGLGVACVAVTCLTVMHFVSPSQVTVAVVNAMSVTTSCFIAIIAYDCFKEALTGRRY